MLSNFIAFTNLGGSGTFWKPEHIFRLFIFRPFFSNPSGQSVFALVFMVLTLLQFPSL